MRLARENHLTAIEDNAQCFLGYYKGRGVGSIGDLSNFSFQASKHMTSNDGGIVITDDEQFARDVRKRSVLGFRTLTARPGAADQDVDQGA